MLVTPHLLSKSNMNQSNGQSRLDRISVGSRSSRNSRYPPSLFSGSEFDDCSDSASIATITDLMDGTPYKTNGQPAFDHRPTMLSIGEKELYDLLVDAELEHYFMALTIQLKVKSVEQLKYVEDSDLNELGFSRPEQRRLKKFFRRWCPQTTMAKLYKRLSLSVGPSSRRIMSRAQPSEFAFTENDSISRSASKASVRTRGSASSSRDELRSDISGVRLNTKKSANYRPILNKHLELDGLLGEGVFGQVYEARWRSSFTGESKVAVRVLDIDSLPISDTASFIDQLNLLQRLKHPHLVTFHGFAMEGSVFKLVNEFAPMGTLVKHLRDDSQRFKFPVPVLHSFSVQLVQAMAYLERSEIPHGKLSAKKLLLVTHDTIKISDFGLPLVSQVRAVQTSGHFPWLAPELRFDPTPTSASDVWAYGVTLWELFSYGQSPGSVVDAQSVTASLNLPQPDACPDPVYDAVLLPCWAAEPTQRPAFKQLLDILPRLCPESWIAARDYTPDLENGAATTNGLVDSALSSNSRSPHRRELGQHMPVTANEPVCVLGKRSSHVWKVFSCRTGLTGCLPVAVLVPDGPANSLSSRDTCLGGGLSKDLSTANSRTSRRGSLSNLVSGSKSIDMVSRTSRFGSTLPRRPSDTTAAPNRTTVKTPSIDAISSPQNNTFRHIGHMDSDGTVQGNLGFTVPNPSEARVPVMATSVRAQSCLNVTRSHNGSSETVSGTSAKSQTSSKRFQLPFGRRKQRSPWRKPNGEIKAEEMTNAKSVTSPVGNGDLGEQKELEFEPVGLGFATSLLDEVFKCFNMDSAELDQETPPPSQSTIATKFADQPLMQTDAATNSTLPLIEQTSSELSVQSVNSQHCPLPTLSVTRKSPTSVARSTTCIESLSVNRTSTGPLSSASFSTSSSSSPSSSSSTVVRKTSESNHSEFRRPRFPSLRRHRSVPKASSIDQLSNIETNAHTPPVIISKPTLISKPVLIERSSASRLSNTRTTLVTPPLGTQNGLQTKPDVLAPRAPTEIPVPRNRRCSTEDREILPRQASISPPPLFQHSSTTDTNGALPLSAGGLPSQGIRGVRQDFVFRAPTFSTSRTRGRLGQQECATRGDVLCTTDTHNSLVSRTISSSNPLTGMKGPTGLLSRMDGLTTIAPATGRSTLLSSIQSVSPSVPLPGSNSDSQRSDGQLQSRT